MSVLLQSVGSHNYGDLIQPGEASPSDFYPIPHDEESAQELFDLAVETREHHTGDIYAAYDSDQGNRFIGSGNVSHRQGELFTPLWVVSTLRRQGYGRALRQALEAQAVVMFPDARSIVAHIHYLNKGSIALIESLGYDFTDETVFGSLLVYRKRIQPIM